MLLASLCLQPGCTLRLGKRADDKDKLLERIAELETRLAEQTRLTESTEKALDALKSQRSSPPDPLPDGAFPPVTTRIEILTASRGVDTDDNGRDDAVRIYLGTYDRRNRFLLTTGTASVTVAAVPAGGGAVTLANQSFDAAAFDEAYRSGIGGTHYTLLVSITTPPPEGVGRVAVSVRLTDLTTGASFDAEKIVNFR